MLRISPLQMRQFGAVESDRFIRRMAAHLRSKFAARAADLPDERLIQQVRLGMAQAEGHGVVFEDDIRRYLEYMVIYGTPLDQRPQAPWLADILQDKSISGSKKLDLIGDYEMQLLRSRR